MIDETLIDLQNSSTFNNVEHPISKCNDDNGVISQEGGLQNLGSGKVASEIKFKFYIEI